MARLNEFGETKGEEVKRLFLALLPAEERGRVAVDIVKDTNGLTKIRIRRIIQERSDGGVAAGPATE